MRTCTPGMFGVTDCRTGAARYYSQHDEDPRWYVQTLLRASYSRFAEQLGGTAAGWINPMYPGAYVYKYYDDKNHDGSAQPNEVFGGILFNNVAYSPAFPGVMVSSAAVAGSILLYEAAANARHLGCEDAAQAFLCAHNEASDVLAGIEAGT